MFRKNTVVAAMLGGALLIGGALPSLADSRHDCEKRIRKAEDNLQREMQRHGERSREAERRRHDLERERQNCRMYFNEKDRHNDPAWQGDHRGGTH